ncbi:energy transducer TonB [Chryseolinea soli]|uniref:Energy transducer TonB n=1 Tax=Chryseolinea soli TaxID=2321403 RepID=A0A385SQA1_9BACT|nr:energy transducer TonB [Chryseolinea soli]AYB32427.1 energy transducer TonB [Chryseolinea soli]
MRIENAEIQSMNDLVFENRNKAYGAYAIRRAYADNVQKALLFVLASAMIAMLFFHGEPMLVDSKIDRGIILDNFTPPKLIPQKSTPSSPVRRARGNAAPTVSTRPEETKQQQTDATTGTPDGPLTGEEPTDPGTIETKTEVITTPPPETHFDPLSCVKAMPEFDGGPEALAKYMRKNLKYPAIARRMSVEGTVFVSFVIDTNGHVIDVKVIKGIMKEFDEEAARVVSNMPPWIAGRIDNTPVMARMVLPIRFQLSH